MAKKHSIRRTPEPAADGQRPVVRWKVADLKKHPSQDDVFGDLAEAELQTLADDMKANGLQHPVEILPDGTIVTGQQRVRAARLLCWTEIDAIVRHDLTAAGTLTVETYLVTDNLNRRQLSPLARARCICRLVELKSGPLGVNSSGAREELKKTAGRMLGLSSRSVSRYLLVLDAPRAVQEAFDRGKISLVTAGRVARLFRSELERIEWRLDHGDEVTEAIAEFLSARQWGGSQAYKAAKRLAQSLARELPHIEGREAKIRKDWPRPPLAILRDAVTILGRLIGADDAEPLAGHGVRTGALLQVSESHLAEVGG